MPKKMHDKLKRQAKKKGLTGEAYKRYVYGTMVKQKTLLKGRKK